MSEEEKKALETVKEELQDQKEAFKYYRGVLGLYSNGKVETLLKLIDKLQKEIEELKKPKYIINCKTNEITKLSNDFISKDKIREKMREIMGYTFTTNEERHSQDYAYDRLKELLEDD